MTRMSKPNKRRQAKKKSREESVRKRKASGSVQANRKIPLADPFLSERMMRRVFLLGNSTPIADKEEMESLMAQAMATTRNIDELAQDKVESDPAEMAQELAFQAMAWEANGEFAKAIRLADQALRLDPECLDAVQIHATSQFDPLDGFSDLARRSMQELRAKTQQKLTARYGDPLAEKAPEVVLRPYHRFLAFLLQEAPRTRRRDDAIDLALEIARLGPNGGMDIRSTMSWLLAGGHRTEADDLLDFMESKVSAHRKEDGTVPHLRWWRSWSAFQAGDLDRSRDLAQAAETAFPESALLIFAASVKDDQLLDTSPYFEENFEHFRSLMDAIEEPDPFHDHVREWLGMGD